MKKRGQISLFLIAGVFIVVLFGLYFYLNRANVDKIAKEKPQPEGVEAVKAYADSCIKMISDEALFEKIGLQGGYMNLPSSPAPTIYQNNDVPIYIDGNNAYLPGLDTIQNQLSHYVKTEFEKCFDVSVFKKMGMEIIKEQDFNVDASLNEEDVTIKLGYPMKISQGSNLVELNSFVVTLPIRIKALYESAEVMASKIKESQPNVYDISADCSLYDKNGLTNVYLKDSNDGSAKIIQFVDFSTYQNYYVNSYVFQFAIKNVNVDGSCVG